MKNYVLLLSAFVLSLAACKKKEDGNSAGWSNNNAASGPNLESVYLPLAPMEQSFTIDAGATSMITTTRGIRFTFEPQSFSRNATPVNGNVVIKVKEYFTNKDLLTGDLNTGHIDGSLLITSGAFRITAFNPADQGVQLMKPVMVSVPERNGNFNPNNRLFIGLIPLSSMTLYMPTTLNWNDDTTRWNQGTFGNVATYDFFINRLNWWNVDRIASAAQGTTKLSVKLPEKHGNMNATVALLLPENGLVKLFGDASVDAFTTGNYNIPIGMRVKILSISKINGVLAYNIHSTTITANETIYITDMQQVSEKELMTIIENDLN
jgi:hypothetical protein